MIRHLFVCGACAVGVVPAVALAASAQPLGEDATAQAITECARANAPSETFAQHGRLETIRPDGDSRTLHIQALGRRSEHGIDANLHVLNPPDLDGMAFLVLAGADQDAMYTFVPALNRTRRVTGSTSTQSLWGTDFSYGDVRQLLGSVGGSQAQRLADATVGEQPTYRLRITPAESDAADYHHAIVDISQAHCVPLGARFLDANDTVLRELVVDGDSIEAADGRHFASRMTMHDRVTGSRTEVELQRVEFDEPIPRRAFHPRGFQDFD